MKKRIMIIGVVFLFLLVGCTTTNKSFERGTFIKGLYKNSFFNVQFYYPEEFSEVNTDTIAFTNGCIVDKKLNWKQALETCKENSIWDLVLSTTDGLKQTGITIIELDSNIDAKTLVNERIEIAKEWAGSSAFVTSAYETKINGQPFQGFSFIAPDVSNPGKEYFGMNAIRVEGNYAMIITVLVNTSNKQDFNDVLSIYTITNNK